MRPRPYASGVPPDPFDTLGLRPRYDLDPGEVQNAYLRRSAKLHPDLAGGDPDAPRLAAELNQAKTTLDDPERRADALLVRLGGPTRSEEKGLPDGFLFEIMEIREAIEGAIASGGAAERAKWEAWARDQRAEYVRKVGAMFAAVGPEADRDALRAIRVELNAWRYIERLIEQLDPDYDPQRADFGAER